MVSLVLSYIHMHWMSGFPKWLAAHSWHCLPPYPVSQGHCPVIWIHRKRVKMSLYICVYLNNNMNTFKEGHLVTQIADRAACVTVTGLTPRLSIQIPVSILTTITPNACHTTTAWALPSHLITYAGAAQWAFSHVCALPVTWAFCKHINGNKNKERQPLMSHINMCTV